MSRQYHYLVAGLPDILFDDSKLEINLAEYRNLLKENLHEADFELIKLFFNRFDNDNLLLKIAAPDAKIDDRGVLSQEDIDELFVAAKDGSALERSEYFPPYLGQFITAQKEDSPLFEGKSWELQLSELYFEESTSTNNSFVRKWFEFERDLKNLITAYQCRKYNIPVEQQLIGKGEIVEKLARSNARDFGLDSDFPFLDQILKALEEQDLKEFEKKIDRIKWDYLDENVFFHYFTIEKLFSFLIKLSIVERWLSLDKPTGQALFNELLSNMEASYEFPDEFKLKK